MDWREQCEAERLETPKEVRQKFLDFLFGGLNLGQAREKAGISFNAAIGIVNCQIKESLYLKREAE